jgi:hypothetical protein
MPTITRDMSKGQLVALAFGQDAVAASQTDVQLPVAMAEASMAVTGYVAPWAGRVVAVAASLSAAATAGTLTVGATFGGTEDADTTMTIATETEKSVRVLRTKAAFAAGAVIGCEITSSASWDGTTADLAAQVYVVYDVEGI